MVCTVSIGNLFPRVAGQLRRRGGRQGSRAPTLRLVSPFSPGWPYKEGQTECIMGDSKGKKNQDQNAKCAPQKKCRFFFSIFFFKQGPKWCVGLFFNWICESAKWGPPKQATCIRVCTFLVRCSRENPLDKGSSNTHRKEVTGLGVSSTAVTTKGSAWGPANTDTWGPMGSLTPHALRQMHPLSPLDRSRTHFKNCNATGVQITVTHFDQLLNPKAASDSAILGWAKERLRKGDGLCPQRKPHGERKVPLEGWRPLKAHPGAYPEGDHVCFLPVACS